MMSHDERHVSADASSTTSRGEASPPGLGGTRDAPAIDEAYFRGRYRDAPYYSTGRDWSDYAPAYRYGLLSHLIRPGQRFEDVEARLAEEWQSVREVSRLVWAEARGAALDAWRLLDDRGVLDREALYRGGAETH